MRFSIIIKKNYLPCVIFYRQISIVNNNGNYKNKVENNNNHDEESYYLFSFSPPVSSSSNKKQRLQKKIDLITPLSSKILPYLPLAVAIQACIEKA
jgi:hypothetical protein